MPEVSGKDQADRNSGTILVTAWPAISPHDSDSLKRRKLAVRAGHLAMAVMVLAAAGGAVLTNLSEYSGLETLVISAGSLSYVLWNLAGTRGIVTLVLWDREVPAPAQTPMPRCGAIPYFTVQLACAAVVYAFADRGRIPNLVWLSLLPPVAYSVFLLEWKGIATVSSLIMLVFVASSWRWHGPGFAAYAALAFSFAILFTIVFSILAVQAERARQEVQRLATELAHANRQLREYAVEAEEHSANRERVRLAREIHDSLGHYLTVVNVQLDAARVLWNDNPAQARDALARAQSLAQEGLQDIRRSVASLRSSPLENQPLPEALRALASTADPALPSVAFELRGEPRKLAPAVELSLFRAAQEGLTNARKHSAASQISVVLDFSSPGIVSMCVADNGVGVPAAANSAGFGLVGLRERAQLLGGTVRVQTTPGAGYRLTFEVPA